MTYVNVRIPVEIHERLMQIKRAGVSWGALFESVFDMRGQIVCPHCRRMRPVLPCPTCESHQKLEGDDEFRQAMAGKPTLSIVSPDHGIGGG